MVQSAILWFQGMTANVVSSLLEGNLYHLGNLYSSCRSWETHNIPAVFRLMLPAATSPLSLSHSLVPFIFFFLPSLISFVDSFLHFFAHLFNPFFLPMSFQFISVTHSCLTLCDPMDCSTPGFSVHHQLPELPQTHDCRVSDAIQPSHPLSSPFIPAFNLSQHQGLFQGISSLHQVAKELEFQLQHQSFQ